MILDKKKRIEFFRKLTSEQRKELILKKMKTKNIKVGSGVPNKSYYCESKEVNELIRIANCFPELRNKKSNKN
tara:strand:- start:362 stop:580 length:219 start_codon:yes stop_codon:yes gene_type:complete